MEITTDHQWSAGFFRPPPPMAVCEEQYDVLVARRGRSRVLVVVLKNDSIIGWSAGTRKRPMN